MKKLIAAMAAVVMMIAAFSGCSDPLAEKQSQQNTEATQATETPVKKAKASDYKDNYEGLRDYFIAKDYIYIQEESKNVTEMQYKLIGAKTGHRYTMDKVTVELYEFNNGSDKLRDEIISSVKKNGYYTLYSRQIKAYVSDSEKFLMIYSDADVKDDDTSSDAYKKMQSAIKDFKAFKGK